MAEPHPSKAFPVKPKLKSKPRTPKQTSESKYWSSFKTHQIPGLISVRSVSFSPSPAHPFAVAHSAHLSIYSSETLSTTSTISFFKDAVSGASFRSDGRLIAASELSGRIQVFDLNSRGPLRQLKSHARPVHFVQFPLLDKFHLISGGDDALVKYWDVARQTPISELRGHKDYVRCGDSSPVNMDTFVTGSYDHIVKLWDIRVTDGRSVMEVNHGKPVEDVIFLPSGGLIATAGGNSVKLWDLLGGGKLLFSVESHNKTVTSICVGKIGTDTGEESNQSRILSVGLDGYMKAFDYANLRVTHSMRFPAPLVSVAFSPDCSTRVIGSSNGIIFAGKRKSKEKEEEEESLSNLFWRVAPVEQPKRKVLRPSHFRYFQSGQGRKPSEGDYVIVKPKKTKLAEHDKLLKKFRHREALVSVLSAKSPENVVAVMEELVARRKLVTCLNNLDVGELELLIMFLQRYCSVPRYASLLFKVAKRVIEMRADDIKASASLRSHMRNLRRSIEEELRIQRSLLEIQGIITPLLTSAARR
ncbi:protein SLOW WALKER 1 [Neltuma alba]|uniref:protein SLOW WALKER 1 n=1 Tax=Neltuma alba TaxID=207710 RepID=UPI0010A46CB6|nr:protein SLOW WALKER 1 [Prosopis alba]